MTLTRREYRRLAMAGAPAAEASILIVCTGNIIRSPFIAAMLDDRLSALGTQGITVSSAGTGARDGMAPSRRAQELARAYGFDMGATTSRRLREPMIRAATTVLCASSEHRREIARLVPQQAGAVFTVREFARLVSPAPAAPASSGVPTGPLSGVPAGVPSGPLSGLPSGVPRSGSPSGVSRSASPRPVSSRSASRGAERWRELAAQASDARRHVFSVGPEHDDIIDPIRGDDAVWREFETLAVDAVEAIARSFAPDAAPA